VKMQILIEVKSAQFLLREGIARGSGKPYSMREQSGWVDTGKPYPQEVRWILADRPQLQAPVEPGKYVLDETAVWVDRNGSLQIDIRRMKPIAQVAAGLSTARQ
jgi:hypothetical protein